MESSGRFRFHPFWIDFAADNAESVPLNLSATIKTRFDIFNIFTGTTSAGQTLSN